ncbi:PKHD-type hydroxylase [Panacagrimonas perspica]|uniref:PKHD-type hydroxylase n=1 Tax=Panacagrimonas perspica TaxID=381431 RepID=A0A4R7PAD4_9GAMM|nr:Fe2+-dependent dioxygenase [Panacagrimonas perspica]TDU30995.1 PKHD-type hydroxylase [Panacagrimonas perspica]THD01856.1 Fe2+-dependent dioxygenase [Panacagrimonas perspica]
MLQQIPDLLDANLVAQFRMRLEAASWEDGKVTAGHQAARVKQNLQLTEEHPLAKELGNLVLQKLAGSTLFTSAALPLKVFPPLFNRYEGGGHFGAHIDTAVRYVNQAPFRVRTDLSATLFLSQPDEYEGGELVIEDTFGLHKVKLPAGHLLLYPASSRHEVSPVTRGTRFAAFFWVQSMIRDDGQRTLLFEMDKAIQQLNADVPGHASMVALTGTYHNLLRRWAEL